MSLVGNPKVAPDCHFPRVVISPIQGIIDTSGTIMLAGTESAPLFNGTINFFHKAKTIEINNIKNNKANLTISGMSFTHSSNQFSAERIGPIEITRIQ